MLRTLRRLSSLLVLLLVWAFIGSDRPPGALIFSEAYADAYPRRYAQEMARPAEKPPHDLASLRLFTKVILYVKDNYVDPARIKPKDMMVAALEYVEKAVPDVMVDGTAESGKLKLSVNGKVRDFDISHVDSLWKMSFTLKDIFDFISKNMRPLEDSRDIEYAAVNGMLSTLDPHSVLLRPEMYREMKLTTKGEFGGLGFVIQMREGNLSVVKVLPKTPAYRGGIKKDDQIRKIGEESTINMDLNEAVSKLRGPVDSKVTITVFRKGWDKPTAMTLTRATISIESVQSKLLAKNVGYVRLKNFQGNTTRDLQTAIGTLAREAASSGGMKGLVLDMRGNPGGLLEQAINVSDLFISSGVLVATVGLSDKLREEKRAHADEGDNVYPLAVLVNTNSASASEIVAGALKNLNRAVIIGRQTFGKGSVQVLYDFPDDSALKLTIAKYLTPGDVSIQEVGVVPDIVLVPTRVTKDHINVFAPRKSIGEADLEHHFGNPAYSAAAKKREEVLARETKLDELKYLKEDAKQNDPSAKQQLAEEGKAPKAPSKGERLNKTGKKPLLDTDTVTGEDLDDQLDAETQDEVKEDFEVLFARDFVLQAPFVEREKMLTHGKAFVEQKRKDEQEHINTAISALGVDWSAGPTPKSVQLISALSPAPDKKVIAGKPLDLELTVENQGKETVKRLRAWTESDNAFLDRREFVIGALAPGQKLSWKVPVKLPKDLTSRNDEVTVKLFDDNGALPGTLISELNFVELARPSFAFNWQIVDDCASCNGDGQIQRGEEVSVLVDVKNMGPGTAMDAFAQIKNAADQNIFIEKGRFKLGEIPSGETKTARFQLEVKKGYRAESFPLKLAILDEPLEEFAAEKLVIPIAGESAAVVDKKTTVRTLEKTAVLGSPQLSVPAIAELPKGASVFSTGAVGHFNRIELQKGRFGFVRMESLKEAPGTHLTASKDFEPEFFRETPQIELKVDLTRGGIVTDAAHFTLTGKVQSPKGLVDVYILVNDQKVYFKSAATKMGEPGSMTFSSDFSLKEGNNNVLVVARQTPDFAGRKTLVIRRRPAAVAQKMSPSH